MFIGTLVGAIIVCLWLYLLTTPGNIVHDVLVRVPLFISKAIFTSSEPKSESETESEPRFDPKVFKYELLMFIGCVIISTLGTYFLF